MSTGQTQRVQESPPHPWLTPNLALVEDWVGSAEIAAMFNVSRQRVYQLTSRRDFPEPMVRLKAGAVWVTADVVRWAREKGREISE